MGFQTVFAKPEEPDIELETEGNDFEFEFDEPLDGNLSDGNASNNISEYDKRPLFVNPASSPTVSSNPTSPNMTDNHILSSTVSVRETAPEITLKTDPDLIEIGHLYASNASPNFDWALIQFSTEDMEFSALPQNQKNPSISGTDPQNWNKVRELAVTGYTGSKGVVESTPLVEHREWPFQGFLKRVTIRNQITYNLEFTLPRFPEHFNLSLHSEVLSPGSMESSVATVVSSPAVTPRKPRKELIKGQKSLLAKIFHEDKIWT
ncbi:hypothetical protein G7Y89_g8704 [Cudoniella acicularis]|uniref:Uncharacterized protein n=1 Tax=Cudoniella acicularis TaxID=354080 RepID=A0A8H4RID2_9HELO|nr:hypothetical protein G7Y89_g8704 [Cudoniella acicularis]